ncbi:RNA-directed DNA polymerase, eukaryota [Tanacetum coccineum]
MESVSAMEVKFLWGNYFFDHIISEASGNSGGILCAWDTNFFKKDHHTISDNFIALYGTWIPNNQKLLIISVYAPQSVSSKRMLWSYLESLITSWNGESLIMGDFNEVRCIEERWGSVFNSHGANAFNSFISNSGLNDIQLEGFSFTWAHPSATKMSKLDRFLMSNGLLSAFPLISAICLDRNTKEDKIQRTPSSTQKNKVEAHPKTVKSSLNNKNTVVEPKGTANVQHFKLNANSGLLCVTYNGCMLSDNHDLCVLDFINDVNARNKSKFVKKGSKRKVWKPTGKVLQILDTLGDLLVGPLL